MWKAVEMRLFKGNFQEFFWSRRGKLRDTIIRS
jgi:hypothetical protein